MKHSSQLYLKYLLPELRCLILWCCPEEPHQLRKVLVSIWFGCHEKGISVDIGKCCHIWVFPLKVLVKCPGIGKAPSQVWSINDYKLKASCVHIGRSNIGHLKSDSFKRNRGQEWCQLSPESIVHLFQEKIFEKLYLILPLYLILYPQRSQPFLHGCYFKIVLARIPDYRELEGSAVWLRMLEKRELARVWGGRVHRCKENLKEDLFAG